MPFTQKKIISENGKMYEVTLTETGRVEHTVRNQAYVVVEAILQDHGVYTKALCRQIVEALDKESLLA